MDKHDSFQKPRIQITPGIFVVAQKCAGQGWIEAWNVLNAVLKRQKINNCTQGEPQNDHNSNHQSR